jgi:polycystin 1L2
MIVHDLQTREKHVFICDKWLAVDKSDGKIERLISAAGQKQKKEIKYLIKSETKEKLSDNHLWLSIFFRPTLSSFNRTDRLTCCFLILYLTMLLNILYYDNEKSTQTASLKMGPFHLSQAEITIGIVSNLIIFVPTFFIIQLFRRSKKPKSKYLTLKNMIDDLSGKYGKYVCFFINIIA